MPEEKTYDLLIIGGGINGAGIACDAAGRGLSVCLCEQGDLASGTSSASTKLIHGGLRYLEYGHFSLVRKALTEREILLNKAPHLITPMNFVMPYVPQRRPRWLLSLGLMIYDHLGARTVLPASRTLSLQQTPLIDALKYGFQYADCWVDDARLVVANAQAAASRGAVIKTYHRVERIDFVNGFWTSTIRDTLTGIQSSVTAKAVVNATGPWISDFLTRCTPLRSGYETQLVQGSHLIVKRKFLGDSAYVLQCDDERIVFVLPYEQHFHLIGTTEREFTGDPAQVRISTEEEAYLLRCYNRYFKTQLDTHDIISRYSGVRPLISQRGKPLRAISRDDALELIEHEGQPWLNVLGGKLTTYRQIAEHALDCLKPYFPDLAPAWTARAPLPGGDIPHAHFKEFLSVMCETYPWLPPHMLSRYARLYGTGMQKLLGDAQSCDDLGACYGADFYEAELCYLMAYEWARTPADILQRRTKLGLVLTPEEQQKFWDIHKLLTQKKSNQIVDVPK